MSDHFGPWIEHDGAGISLPDNTRIQWTALLPGLVPEEGATIDTMAHPSFFWRWRRVRKGWFGSELVRVCDNPAYAPIYRYRVQKPRGLLLLQQIAERPPADLIGSSVLIALRQIDQAFSETLRRCRDAFDD